VDKPGPRKVHQEPIPLLGGGAVALSFLLVVGGIISSCCGWGNRTLGCDVAGLAGQYPLALALWPKLGLILASALLIFALGVLDDAVGVNFDFRLKFAVQFAWPGSWSGVG